MTGVEMAMMNKLSWLIALAVTITVVGCGERASKSKADAGSSPKLQRLTTSSSIPSYATRGKGPVVWKQVRRFYTTNVYHFAWMKKGRPASQVGELVELLEAADREGFDPAEYETPRMRELRESSAEKDRDAALSDARLAEIDAWLTYQFMRYATHLSAGKIDPQQIDRNWRAAPRGIDLSGVLQQALDQHRFEAVSDQLAPRHPEYSALREALAQYRDLRIKGGWPVVPATTTLKIGAKSPVVTVLRQRLGASGDFGSRNHRGASPVFDRTLEGAVRNFQTRHGLESDGVLDAETLAAINVPIDRRIEQIQLNMERWRWLPDELGPRHIRLNVPAFRLDLVENARIVTNQRVIVGKAESRTPIFSDQMTNLVFSPYWNIPESIVENETLPRALQDPGFLERNNIEVVRATGGEEQVLDPAAVDWAEAVEDSSLRLRQKPGPGNSLGLVKFIFPNHFNVYLHDTPADNLFKRIERDYSHGCVRVEQPLELAQAVLRDQPQWTTERIKAAMHSGQQQTVALKQPIPVHMVYFTVMPYDNGAIQFRDDVYGYDRTQAELARTRRQGARREN